MGILVILYKICVEHEILYFPDFYKKFHKNLTPDIAIQ